jgi:hypothetical protein
MDQYFQQVRPMFCTLASWVSYITFHKLHLFPSPGRKGTEGSLSGELVLYITVVPSNELNYNLYPFPPEGENIPGFQNVVYEANDGRVRNTGSNVLHCTTTILLLGWISVLTLIWRAQILPFYCIFEHTSP